MQDSQTKLGSKIERGFVLSNGLSVFSMLKKDFTELYYGAEFYWAKINIDKLQIISFTEGDTATVTCPNLKVLLQEAREYVNCARSQCGDRAVGEWPELEKEIIRRINA